VIGSVGEQEERYKDRKWTAGKSERSRRSAKPRESRRQEVGVLERWRRAVGSGREYIRVLEEWNRARESRSGERSSVEGQGSGQEGGQRVGREGVGERADQPVTTPLLYYKDEY
jgi:hypothetical protein